MIGFGNLLTYLLN